MVLKSKRLVGFCYFYGFLDVLLAAVQFFFSSPGLADRQKYCCCCCCATISHPMVKFSDNFSVLCDLMALHEFSMFKISFWFSKFAGVDGTRARNIPPYWICKSLCVCSLPDAFMTLIVGNLQSLALFGNIEHLVR